MPPQLRFLPAIVLTTVALAACGGDDETTTSTTAPATGPTGATGAAELGAPDPEAKTKASTAQTALEVYFTENASYAGADAKSLEAIEPSLPADIEIKADDESFSITVPSASGNSFTLERDKTGTVTRTCTEPGVRGCGEDGEW